MELIDYRGTVCCREVVHYISLRPMIMIFKALFYIQYVAVIVGFAVLPAKRIKDAAIRGLGIGWVAYATYELTNWAVIEAWPPGLIVVDVAWGLLLTATVAGGLGAIPRGAARSDCGHVDPSRAGARG